MGMNKYLQIPDEPEYEQDIDAQIARLREILVLMAPETGSKALGALRQAAPHLPLAQRLQALSRHRS
jgi:hypothetical protein